LLSPAGSTSRDLPWSHCWSWGSTWVAGSVWVRAISMRWSAEAPEATPPDRKGAGRDRLLREAGPPQAWSRSSPQPRGLASRLSPTRLGTAKAPTSIRRSGLESRSGRRFLLPHAPALGRSLGRSLRLLSGSLAPPELPKTVRLGEFGALPLSKWMLRVGIMPREGNGTKPDDLNRLALNDFRPSSFDRLRLSPTALVHATTPPFRGGWRGGGIRRSGRRLSRARAEGQSKSRLRLAGLSG
jgi:hypothetical protein